MRFKLLFIFLLIFSFHFTWSQEMNYKELLHIAIKSSEQLFVDVKPITKIQLENAEMPVYRTNLYLLSKGQILDTIMFSEIIQNCQNIDTTLWTDNELPKSILIRDRHDTVDLLKVIKKLKIETKEDKKYYRNIVSKFNHTFYFDREIYQYSKPVFDNSRKFAIIKWDNYHSGLCCGGKIILYKLKDGKWILLGEILNWKY